MARRLAAFTLSVMLCLMLCSGGAQGENAGKTKYGRMTAEEILATLTLPQKVSQMLQPACYNINESMMKDYCFGSLVSQGEHLDAAGWREYPSA